MENKLEQLTQKLYREGLSKGRSEGERILSEAEAKAAEIIGEAEAGAAEIIRKAHSQSEDLRKNTMTEISLAGRQAVGKIKDEIANAIVAKSISEGVREANMDPEFIREMLLAVARNWDGSSSERVSLEALLPASRRDQLDAAFSRSAAELLAEGIEVGYSEDVHSGFTVGEKGGGYYIGFSDADFEALLGRYLREKVSRILYGKE